MFRIIKIALVILFLPSFALAKTCADDDVQCKQLAIMNELKIKPSTVQKPTPSPQKTNEPKQAAKQKQFEIPKISAFPEPKPTSPNKNKIKPKPTSPTINIFAPNATATTDQSAKTNPQIEQQTPYNIPEPSSTGMQYR